MADEQYWIYKTSTPTPTWIEALWCRAINQNTTEQQWNSLSPGMRREIVRTNLKKVTNNS